MNRVKSVIVDDEPMARQSLRRMLSDFPEIEICGEADGVDPAEEMIRETGAKLLFLDIELFGESGFDLVPRLDSDIRIIFVTAFNQYAIRAFEVNALDYLLKPVSRNRLAEAVRRLSPVGNRMPDDQSPKILTINDLVLVEDQKKRRWQPLAEVCLIRVEGDYTTLCSIDGRRGVKWQSLSDWEKVLPGELFVRIHRGMIVNLNHVDTFTTLPGYRIQLELTGYPRPCIASRRFTPEIRPLLNSINR